MDISSLWKPLEFIYKSFKGDIAAKVAIKGSIITKIQIVKDEFINEFVVNDIKIKLYDEDVSSAKGAYYKGISEIKGE